MAVDPTPVMWDARIYSSAALGLLYYGGNGDTFGHPESRPAADSAIQRADFEKTMAKYIQGEQIEWLYYYRPTVSQAEEYIFIPGPIYPLYLALIFLLSIGATFIKVRILNAFVDGFCVMLLMHIAEQLFGRRESIMAGIAYIFYLPFILLTGLISPDSITLLLILATFFMIIQWQQYRENKQIYLTGLLLGILALTKPTAALLFVPFGLGFIWEDRKRLKENMGIIGKGALPFILVTLPWFIITSLYFGQPAIRDPNYSEANFRSSSSIKYEGYDLDYAEKDFWLYPVSYTISRDPLGYAGLLVKKFVRLWGQPYNDFKQSFILNPTLARIYHYLIIIPGLFGIMLFIIKKKPGLIYLFMIPLYYTIIHIILHSLARYNLNAMPFVILASSAVWMKIYDHVVELWKKKKILFITILSFVFCTAVLLLPGRLLVNYLGESMGVSLNIIVKLLAIVLPCLYLFKLLLKNYNRMAALRFISVPAVIFSVVIMVIGLSPDSWAEWKCRLSDAEKIAGVRIYIPSNFRLAPDNIARIGLDLSGTAGMSNQFVITVNGRTAQFTVGKPPLDVFYYKKATYPVFQALTGVTRDEMRYWSFLPLTGADFNKFLDENGFIDIQLTLLPSPGSSLKVYGDYPIDGPDNLSIRI